MKNYENIIKFTHFHDPSRPYMSMRDRAAQFTPYKSLTGYDEMISAQADEILGKKL